MKYMSVIYQLIWGLLCVNAQYCTTPLGKESQCISLYQCPEFLNAIQLNHTPPYIVNFLRQSKCGYDMNTPKVCCGPLPSDTRDNIKPKGREIIRTTTKRTDSPMLNEDKELPPHGTCGLSTSWNRILSGTNADLDEFPWMALLGYRSHKRVTKYECVGSLINKLFILTAAHCLSGPILTEVGVLTTVRLGEYDTQKNIDCIDEECADPPQDIPVQASYVNPNYLDNNRDKSNDIGLVKLSRRANYTDYVKPICLGTNNNIQFMEGTSLMVAGWGKTLSGYRSSIKQKLRLQVFNKNACIQKYRTLRSELNYNQICAGGDVGKDTCGGDSGGPLMMQNSNESWEVVGIVSLGYGCGKEGWPGVYTSVAGYIDWIMSTIES